MELVALQRIGVPWEVGLRSTAGERWMMLDAVKALDTRSEDG